MRTNILNSMVRAAAVLAIPTALWAQNLGAPSGELNGLGGPDPAPQSSPAATPPPQQSPVMSGIIVQDGSAYIVHRLQGSMSLPDGSKVQPNGIIMGRDGSLRSMDSGQMLTLDGRMMPAPFSGPGMMSSGPMLPGMSGLPGDMLGTGSAGFLGRDLGLMPESGSFGLSSPEEPSIPSFPAGSSEPESRSRDDNNAPNFSSEQPSPSGDFSD